MPVRVVGPWSVAVGPGLVRFGERAIQVNTEVRLDVPPPQVIQVTDEGHLGLPIFNLNTGGWLKGARLRALITQECTAAGNLFPESVVVRSEDGQRFVLGQDFAMDGFWATLGRLQGGRIEPDQKVLISYRYSPNRLDSIVLKESGRVRLLIGEAGLSSILPPRPEEGDVVVANIWVPGRSDELSEDNLFPIEGLPDLVVEPTAERLLPETLAKLRAGQEVTIVAWGDSVTAGGGVGPDRSLWYQYRFRDRLAERFPKAQIRMLTAAWGGATSRMYMDASSGGAHDFQRDVLDPRPDLVTIEFVNDAYLDEEQTQTHYTEIMQRLNGIGAEVILITPHLVRPDWMGVKSLKFDVDPRPYVKGLRRFAAEHNVALADASLRWCRLWRQGIPYVTLEANSINHPDVRGMDIFVEALMSVFPLQ